MFIFIIGHPVTQPAEEPRKEFIVDHYKWSFCQVACKVGDSASNNRPPGIALFHII